jgi:hypothetical protein
LVTQPRNEAEEGILQFLSVESQLREEFKPEGWKYASVGQLLADKGQFDNPQSLPEEYECGAQKECYKNSALLALSNRDLTYVEGYVIPSGVPIPVAHAWCVDRQNNVIDVTLREPGKAYLGIHFDRDFLTSRMLETEVYGIFGEFYSSDPDTWNPLRDGIPERAVKGGPGSGHFGHAGRPGARGGSMPGRATPAFAKDDPRSNPNFRRWFGDSKLVDSDGEPLVLHHGTAAEFDVFEPERAGEIQRSDWGPGIYFTPQKWQADSYREEALKRTDPVAGRLWDEYVEAARELGTTPMMGSIDLGRGSEKWLQLEVYADRWLDRFKEIEEEGGGKVISAYVRMENPLYHTGGSFPDSYLAMSAAAQGHDGIIITYEDGGIDEIVVFDSSQIKSVDNVGEFDPRDPSIYKELGSKGGPGSGHHGHVGRPGKRGGSAPGPGRRSSFDRALGHFSAKARRQVRDSIAEVQQRGLETGNENMVVYNSKGEKIDGTIEGREDRVDARGTAVGDYIERETDESVIIHNHPNSASFSNGDVTFFVTNDVEHMIVAGHDGTLYRLSKTPESEEERTEMMLRQMRRVIRAHGFDEGREFIRGVPREVLEGILESKDLSVLRSHKVAGAALAGNRLWVKLSNFYTERVGERWFSRWDAAYGTTMPDGRSYRALIANEEVTSDEAKRFLSNVTMEGLASELRLEYERVEP